MSTFEGRAYLFSVICSGECYKHVMFYIQKEQITKHFISFTVVKTNYIYKVLISSHQLHL